MLLHEFYSDEDCSRGLEQLDCAILIANVVIQFNIKHSNRHTIVEERNIQGHSEVYAENCAENWVLGVIT